MRFSRLVLILMPLALILGFYSSTELPVVAKFVKNYGSKLKVEKQIKISGLQRLKISDLALQDFESKTLWWWYWNKSFIKTRLLENTWLESADIKPCGWLSPNCLQVSLKERVPSAVINLNHSNWIVDNDGSFIQPISSKVKHSLPILEGFDTQGGFSEDLRARLRYTLNAIGAIQHASRMEISKAKLEPNGELKVVFQNLEPEVTFGLSNEGTESLELQAKRLALILTSMHNMGNNNPIIQVSQIDLAYNNLAVVKPLK